MAVRRRPSLRAVRSCRVYFETAHTLFFPLSLVTNVTSDRFVERSFVNGKKRINIVGGYREKKFDEKYTKISNKRIIGVKNFFSLDFFFFGSFSFVFFFRFFFERNQEKNEVVIRKERL